MKNIKFSFLILYSTLEIFFNQNILLKTNDCKQEKKSKIIALILDIYFESFVNQKLSIT
jgi:hypothetical protein